MRLRATRPCSVRIADLDLRVEFAAGEELRTEISCKFTRPRIEDDLAAAGLELERFYTDDQNLFALTLARPARYRATTADRARAAMPDRLSVDASSRPGPLRVRSRKRSTNQFRGRS